MKPSSGEMSGDVAATVSSQFYLFLPATAQPSLQHNMLCMATRFHRENHTRTSGSLMWTRPREIHVHAFPRLSRPAERAAKSYPRELRSLSRRRGAASGNPHENSTATIKPNSIDSQRMKEIASYSQNHKYCSRSDIAAKSLGVQ